MRWFMYTLTDNSAFIWQDFGEGAEILRVYADNPHLCIPEKINGKNVLSAGPYCFSEIRRVCEEEWKESDRRQELISVSADKLRLTYYWDEEGTENMIPVWELTGTFRFSTEEGGEREESDSILMINAIDGTIISRF